MREENEKMTFFPFKTYSFNKDFLKITKNGEMLAMKNRKYLPKKPWKRFTSTPLLENTVWHL